MILLVLFSMEPVICKSSLPAPITSQEKNYVGDSINALINGAPSTLDNLEERANAIGNLPNLARHFTASENKN